MGIMRRFAGFARFIGWERQRGGTVDLERLRARYAADILGSTGVENPRVEAAFAAVPREDFLTSRPWRILLLGGVIEKNTSDPSDLYIDVLGGARPRQGHQQRPALAARPHRRHRSTSPTWMWGITSAQNCRPSRPTRTSASRKPKPKCAAQRPWPSSRRCAPGHRKCEQKWWRRKRSCRKQWRTHFARGIWE